MSQQQSKKKTPRPNRIYRCPPTPEPAELLAKEKAFIIDSNACASISGDYSKANPKLGPVIAPYNSQRDKHVDAYFDFIGVNKTLKKTGQKSKERPLGTSIEGPVMERFHESGAGFQYLSRKHRSGSGHSREQVDGHAQFMQGIKPVMGYNGKYGFRRNTPWLRNSPSPFGTASTSPTQ